MDHPTWVYWLLLGLVALAPLVLPMLLRGPERRQLERGVAHLGLEVRHALAPRTAVARGRVEGFEVEVRYVYTERRREPHALHPPVGARVAVRVRLPRPLAVALWVRTLSASQQLLRGLGAQDLPLDDPPLDRALRVAAREPSPARATLADPTVAALLREVATQDDHHVELDPQELRLAREGVHAVEARPTVDLALALARALLRAQHAPTAGLCAELGLVAGPPGPDGRQRLAGAVDGVAVEVRLVPGEGEEPARTHLRARIEPPLPGAPRLRRRAPGEAAGLSTGNPVLDTAVLLRCVDPVPVRRLLAHDEVTGPLMELLHGQRDAEARVGPDLVALARDGWSLDGVDVQLRLLAEVARVLQAAARA